MLNFFLELTRGDDGSFSCAPPSERRSESDRPGFGTLLKEASFASLPSALLLGKGWRPKSIMYSVTPKAQQSCASVGFDE
jgi:hypothetical protein